MPVNLFRDHEIVVDQGNSVKLFHHSMDSSYTFSVRLESQVWGDAHILNVPSLDAHLSVEVILYRIITSLLFKKDLFNIWAVLSLWCCTWAFSSCSQLGLLSVAAHELLIAVASLVVQQGSRAHRLQWLQCVGSGVVVPRLTGSVAVVHGFSWSEACGIFLHQRSINVHCIIWQIFNHQTTREDLITLL